MLTRSQDAAIGALLAQPTLALAAHTVGVNERTPRRWMKEPEFLATFRAARRDSLEHSMALLQKARSAAVEPLQQSLQAESETVALRASCAILDYALKANEVLDLVERISVLEQQVSASKNGRIV